MRVIRVKTKRERDLLEREILKRRKVLAVVTDPKDLESDLVRKADVVILDESQEEDRSDKLPKV